MNTTVSFEIAKLLKEKGFNKAVRWYMEDGVTLSGSNETADYLLPGYYSAPTIAETVMWLYDEYGVWIEGSHCGTFNDFTFKVSKLNKKNVKKEPHYMHDLSKGFNSPTEAYESAIIYTLKNLI